MSAGNVKRDRIQKAKETLKEEGLPVNEGTIAEKLPEQEVRSVEWFMMFWVQSR